MGKPENTIRKFRCFFFVTFLVGGLLAGCSSGDGCEDGTTLNATTGECQGSVVASQGDSSGTDNRDVSDAENSVDIVVPATIEEINLVVLVTGQSNVEAAETEFDEVLDMPHQRVFAFTDSGWQIADLHQVWDEHAHPGNHSLTDPARSPNNNFAFHFGGSLARQDSSIVPAFIILAAPGRGIANWDKDSLFYQKISDKVTAALAQLPHKDSLDLVLWHQGESDWQYEGTSDVNATEFLDRESADYKIYYRLKLRNLIANFRSELWVDDNAPFICGETRVAEGVNRRLMELNSDDDPNSACVRASDLPYRLSDPTGNHFSAPGLRELGRRYMQQYLAIRNR